MPGLDYQWIGNAGFWEAYVLPFCASSRSCCCCWFFFSSARWSIGSGSGGMDGNYFGPREQILWPASVLAGIVMCGAVSFPHLVPPRFFLPFTS